MYFAGSLEVGLSITFVFRRSVMKSSAHGSLQVDSKVSSIIVAQLSSAMRCDSVVMEVACGGNEDFVGIDANELVRKGRLIRQWSGRWPAE